MKTLIKKSPMKSALTVIILVIILLTIVSGVIWGCNSWLSSVFLSFGCGLLSGLIVYFLGNRRINQLFRFEFEYSILKNTYNDARNLCLVTEYYLKKCNRGMDEEDLDNCLNDILTKAENVSERLYEYPEVLFNQLGIDVTDEKTLDTDYLWKKYNSINDYNEDGLKIAESLFREVSIKMTTITGKLQPVRNAWKEKYYSLRKSCF